jgi:hypothetical protein
MATKKTGTKSASKSASKAARKSSARKSGAKSTDQTERDKALLERAKDAPIGGNVLGNDPLGPGVEHEDHEGGETDSLARRGVRGPITPDRDKAAKQKKAPTGAPSVRERQTAPFATQGGARRARPDAVSVVENKNKKETKVVVIATRQGFYPADGRLRRRGDVFEYTMLPGDGGKLPSWMIAREGGVETRAAGETSDAFDNEPAATLQVSKRGEVTQV